jgi:hypothetical protein
MFTALAAAISMALVDSLPCEVSGSHEWLSTRASPLDSVEVSLPAVTVKICYSRPRARGRSVYGSLAPFGQAWRTGANEPTTIRLSRSATIGGATLSAGRYLILSVPDSTRWLVVFYTATGTDASEMFRTRKEVATGTASVERLATPVDQFTIRSTMGPEGTAFLLEWGHLRARLPVSTP